MSTGLTNAAADDNRRVDAAPSLPAGPAATGAASPTTAAASSAPASPTAAISRAKDRIGPYVAVTGRTPRAVTVTPDLRVSPDRRRARERRLQREDDRAGSVGERRLASGRAAASTGFAVSEGSGMHHHSVGGADAPHPGRRSELVSATARRVGRGLMERSDMRNSALLHNVSDRASQAGILAEHTLREVAERVADTASDLASEFGDRVPQVVSVLPALAAPQRRRKRRGRKLLLLAVLVAVGVGIFGWKRRSQAAQLANENRDGFRP